MPEIKPFDVFSKKEDSVKRKANKREKRLEKQLGKGTQRQPCSGALLGMKGDLIDNSFLYDSKGTDGLSISVKAEDLLKISKEANGRGKHPALVLTLCKQDWVCIEKDVFNTLIGRDK